MKRLAILSAVLLIFMFVPAAQAAQVLVNGGFEAGPGSIGSYLTLNAGDTSLTGWDITSGSIDLIGTYWTPQEGSRSIDLNGIATGSISQSFNTIVGQSYHGSFYMAGNPDGGSTTKVLIAGGGGGPYANYFFDTTGSDKTSMNWALKAFDFTAVTAISTISFSSLESGAYGAALDNIKVEGPAPAQVPEPSTLLLLGSGLLGIVVIRRKKII